MIRRHTSVFRSLLMLLDGVVALVVLGILSELRFGAAWETTLQASLRVAWAPMLLLYAAGWVALLYLEGQYRLRAQWRLRTEVMGILRAGAWMALLTVAALFLLDATDLSRLFLVALFPLQAAATIATRSVLRWWFSRLRANGRNTRNVLVLGTGPRAVAFARQVEDHTALGLRILGFLGDEPGDVPGDWPHLGPVASIVEVLHANVVDEVAICLP